MTRTEFEVEKFKVAERQAKAYEKLADTLDAVASHPFRSWISFALFFMLVVLVVGGVILPCVAVYCFVVKRPPTTYHSPPPPTFDDQPESYKQIPPSPVAATVEVDDGDRYEEVSSEPV